MSFPQMEELNQICGPNLFFGWKFIRGIDGVVYFANCIEPGITKEEVEEN